MRINRVPAFVLAAMLGILSISAFAADELFDTKTAEKHIEQGIAFLKAKNFNAAVSEFEESAVILPDAEAYYYLGYAYYLKSRSGDEDSRKKSLENFDKAYEIDPNFSPTRYKPAEAGMTGERQMPKKDAAISPASPPPAQAAQQPSQPAPQSEQPKQ